MSRIEAKKIVRKYAEKLKKENYSFQMIYLFGSFAQNKSHKWSDIDVAIISDKLKPLCRLIIYSRTNKIK